MPCQLTEADVKNQLSTDYLKITKFAKNSVPMPIVLVEYGDKTDYDAALQDGVSIGNMFFYPEKYVEKKKVVRCFKCQKLGHISKNCQSVPKCSHCAGDHVNKNCELQAKCVNCEAQHPSSSVQCPKYRSIFEKLNFLESHH